MSDKAVVGGAVVGGLIQFFAYASALAGFPNKYCDPPLPLYIMSMVGVILCLVSLVLYIGWFLGKIDDSQREFGLGLLVAGICSLVISSFWMIPMYGQIFVLFPSCF